MAGHLRTDSLSGVSRLASCTVLGSEPEAACSQAEGRLGHFTPPLDTAVSHLWIPPTLGVCYGAGLVVNQKAVYRALRIKQWLVSQRTRTPRPRAQRLSSRAPQRNHRWAKDVTHIPCGQDGWGPFTAGIDYHDREMIGYEFALRGRSKEAERALEAACLARFGTLRPVGTTPMVRSDKGLIFQSRRFRQACREYRLSQEFITPNTPEQNGLIERFFRSLKEECVWQHQFANFEEARKMINPWM